MRLGIGSQCRDLRTGVAWSYLLDPTISLAAILRMSCNKLLQQGYVLPRLITTFKKFYERHHDLVDKYDKPISHMV